MDIEKPSIKYNSHDSAKLEDLSEMERINLMQDCDIHRLLQKKLKRSSLTDFMKRNARKLLCFTDAEIAEYQKQEGYDMQKTVDRIYNSKLAKLRKEKEAKAKQEAKAREARKPRVSPLHSLAIRYKDAPETPFGKRAKADAVKKALQLGYSEDDLKKYSPQEAREGELVSV